MPKENLSSCHTADQVPTVDACLQISHMLALRAQKMHFLHPLFNSVLCVWTHSGPESVCARKKKTDTRFFSAEMKEESHTNTIRCTHTHTHTPRLHATQCLLPRSVFVDHMTVLRFLWRPNGGALAIANTTVTAGGETLQNIKKQWIVFGGKSGGGGGGFKGIC